MVKLSERSAEEIFPFPNREGCKETYGQFAKRDALSKIRFKKSPTEESIKNRLLVQYYSVKEFVMSLIPESHYHKKREKFIDSLVERI